MEFKQIATDELTPFDVSEWDATAQAYVKQLTALERLVFNDYFLAFYDKDKTPDERFRAGFKAALMAIVDGNGAPLITVDDERAASRASLDPIIRLFGYYLSGDRDEGELETAKKN